MAKKLILLTDRQQSPDDKWIKKIEEDIKKKFTSGNIEVITLPPGMTIAVVDV